MHRATFSAQQVLMPALAPFARETGLSETQLGSVIGIAAGILVLAAPLWARTCAHQGPRAILVTGLLLTLVGCGGFALVATAALDGQLSGGATFALVLLGAPTAALGLVCLALAGGAPVVGAYRGLRGGDRLPEAADQALAPVVAGPGRDLADVSGQTEARLALELAAGRRRAGRGRALRAGPSAALRRRRGDHRDRTPTSA